MQAVLADSIYLRSYLRNGHDLYARYLYTHRLTLILKIFYQTKNSLLETDFEYLHHRCVGLCKIRTKYYRKIY